MCISGCVHSSCLVEVMTGCRHPNQNLIRRREKLFLNFVWYPWIVLLPFSCVQQAKAWYRVKQCWHLIYSLKNSNRLLFAAHMRCRKIKSNCVNWLLSAFPSSMHCFVMCNYESDLIPLLPDFIPAPKIPLQFHYCQVVYLSHKQWTDFSSRLLDNFLLVICLRPDRQNYFAGK